jgi:hypothetical protein
MYSYQEASHPDLFIKAIAATR